MKLLLLVFIVLISASSLIQVNDKNFRDVVINSGKFTLVDFYADWCRHCMKLMPTIEQLAELYADIPEIQIVKINGDEDGRKMTKKYKIPGFPFLYMFNGENDPVEFEGMRDLESISNFVQQVSGIKLSEKSAEYEEESFTNVIKVNDENFQEQVLRANHKTVVAFTAPWCQHCQKLSPIYSKLANQVYAGDEETIRFAEVDLSEENKANVAKISDQFGVSSLPTLLLFNPNKVDADGLKRPLPYTDERSLEKLLAFINIQTGLGRTETGALTSEAGRIQHLDEAVHSLTEETRDLVMSGIESLKQNLLRVGKDDLVEQGHLALGDDVSMIPYYTKLAHKVASGDTSFLVNELARLERITTKNARDLEKSSYDYMQKRINILRAYFSK